MSEERINAYLQRLTGSQPNPKLGVKLSSAQKAAFAAWMRRNGMEFSPAVLRQAVFSLEVLFGAEATVPNPPAPKPALRGPALLSGLRVGIDMEQTTSLPDASDYRVHEFYRDNFTPTEIAYCLQRRDPKRSLCGLWAAKEAAAKVLGCDSAAGLREIEIGHDADGRPFCKLGELSISHSGDFSVAIFIAFPKGRP